MHLRNRLFALGIAVATIGGLGLAGTASASTARYQPRGAEECQPFRDATAALNAKLAEDRAASPVVPHRVALDLIALRATQAVVTDCESEYPTDAVAVAPNSRTWAGVRWGAPVTPSGVRWG